LNALRRLTTIPRARRVAVLLAAATALAVPSAAHASGSAVIKDCINNGHLTKSYSAKDYADALKSIPTDVAEYSDCADIIQRAQLSAGRKSSSGSSSSSTTGGGGGGGTSSGGGGGGTTSGGGGGTGGGSTAGGGASAGAAPPTTADQALQTASAQEKAAIDAARNGADAVPVDVAGAPISPQDLKSTDLSSLNTVPTPMLIVLGLLALAFVGGGGTAILNRVRARRARNLGV
jgi:hypothetical protein